MIDAKATENVALIGNATAQVETLLLSLKKAAGVTADTVTQVRENSCFFCNAGQREFMFFLFFFKQDGVISTLSGKLLKMVDYFTNLESSSSSAESNVNTSIRKFTNCNWNVADHMEI